MLRGEMVDVDHDADPVGYDGTSRSKDAVERLGLYLESLHTMLYS